MAKPLVKSHCPENCKCKIKDGEGACYQEFHCYREAYYCPRCNELLFVASVSTPDSYGLTAAIQGKIACLSCKETIELDSSLPKNELGLSPAFIQQLGLAD